jgi:FkbM family methyltransferase
MYKYHPYKRSVTMGNFVSVMRGLILSIRRHALAKRSPVLPFFRFFKVQVITKLTRRPLLVPFVNDTKIYVYRGETSANGCYYLGLREFTDMIFALHYLRPGDLFVDVGANVGSYTLLASGAVGAKSIAFEPVPTTVNRLRSNVAANGIDALVEIRPICVGAKEGIARFTTDADATNHVLAQPNAERSYIEVPVGRLDAEIASPPSLIKIDAEGTDNVVLDGATGILSSTRPMAILIEDINSDNRRKLEALGFYECSYDPFRRIISKGSSGKSIWNILFIRDINSAISRVQSARSFKVPGFGSV